MVYLLAAVCLLAVVVAFAFGFLCGYLHAGTIVQGWLNAKGYSKIDEVPRTEEAKAVDEMIDKINRQRGHQVWRETTHTGQSDLKS